MDAPEGTLTAVQYRIMEAVWGKDGQGATVTEIWQAMGAHRGVGRTTVLNLVDRLEKRGWLTRDDGKRPLRYHASRCKDETTVLLADRFVQDFFQGSASNLVMSLLGSRQIEPEEIDRLRELLRASSQDDGAPQEDSR